MTELLDRLPAPENYSFHVSESHRSRIKIFAPHGGCIEPCTEPVALSVARDMLDCFVFSGKRTSGCFKTLHVTSTHYDEPRCLRMVRASELAIAIHGCEGEESSISFGGGNTEMSSNGLRFFREHGYHVAPAAAGMSGEDKRNFINQARRQGVQFELSAGFRRMLFPGFPKGIQRHPQEFPKFIRLMRDWIRHIEATLVAEDTV